MKRSLSSKEELLTQLLRSTNGEDLARVPALAAGIMVTHFPQLVRHAERQGIANAEDLVQDAILRGLRHIEAQAAGHTPRFKWDGTIGMFFWLRLIVGTAGGGKKSGLVGPRLRAQNRAQEREVGLYLVDSDGNEQERPLEVLTDNEECLQDEGDAHTQQEKREEWVASAVAALPPREQLVVRLRYGLHEEGCLSKDALERLCLRCGCPPVHARKYRKKLSLISLEQGQNELSATQIGVLLGITQGGVNSILRKVRQVIKKKAA